MLDRLDLWLAQWWWARPFLLCLLVTGILGYLGTHVLARKVIFVDLATAQIAALGAAYAALLGYEAGRAEDQVAIYAFSLGFALAGAALIALTRMKRETVPQEAFIGIFYAGASALAMLVLSKSPTEGEQIKAMLVGSLLSVRLPRILVTALVCGAVGAFHWFFREKFYLLSADVEAAERSGLSVRLWDFLFYVSLGLVITACVTVAGVLLVFSYLVVPAVIAVMFAERTRVRIATAWGVGALVSVLGMVISNEGDFPTGPSVVAAFMVALVAAGIAHYVMTHERSGVAVGRLAAGAALMALAVWGTTFLRRAPEDHHHHAEDEHTRLMEALQSDNDRIVIDALHHIENMNDKHAVQPVVELIRTTKSEGVLEHASHTLARLGDPEALPALKEIGRRDLDDDLKVHVASAILDLRDASGLPMLIDVLEKGEARIPREEARRLFEERTGRKADDVAAVKKWLEERGAALRWRPQTGRFE